MQRLKIYINNFLLHLIGWYIGKDLTYSKLYSLNHRLMGVSASPVPGTWLELDWISNHPWPLYKDFEENHLLNAFRRHQLIYEISEIEDKKIKGDFLELGVYKGFSAHVMLSYGSANRNYFGFDTFAGLSEPMENVDGSHWAKGDLAFSETAAMAKLEKFKARVMLIKGEIPGVFKTLPADKMQFALVHIDLDLYEPTKSGLSFAWEKLTPGGSLICDDYGFATCPGASKAVDEFFLNRNDFQAFRSVVGGIVVRKHG
jgi:SAM-dependent methyltransferase